MNICVPPRLTRGLLAAARRALQGGAAVAEALAKEEALLDRLLRKNASQHRASRSFKKLKEVGTGCKTRSWPVHLSQPTAIGRFAARRRR
jgi:hypothetical protein